MIDIFPLKTPKHHNRLLLIMKNDDYVFSAPTLFIWWCVDLNPGPCACKSSDLSPSHVFSLSLSLLVLTRGSRSLPPLSCSVTWSPVVHVCTCVWFMKHLKPSGSEMLLITSGRLKMLSLLSLCPWPWKNTENKGIKVTAACAHQCSLTTETMGRKESIIFFFKLKCDSGHFLFRFVNSAFFPPEAS